MKKAITRRLIETVESPESGRVEIRDDKTPGLILHVSATGAKTLGFRGKVKGRTVRISFGLANLADISRVKTDCLEYYRQCRAGKDPVANRGLRTFGDLIEYWQRAKADQSTIKERARAVEEYAGRWRRRAIESITVEVCRSLHLSITRKGYKSQANRVLNSIRSAFTVAIRDGVLELQQNPASLVTQHRDRERRRFLDADELKRFGDSLLQEPEIWQDYFALLLATGQRKGKVQSMRFDDIDLQRRTWQLDETKNGDAIEVPLVIVACEIIEKRAACVRGEYVFPAIRRRKSNHIKRDTEAFQRICKRAQIDSITVHDLRHTTASWLVNEGETLQVVAAMLGHRSLASSKRYAHLTNDRIRTGAERAAVKIFAG